MSVADQRVSPSTSDQRSRTPQTALSVARKRMLGQPRELCELLEDVAPVERLAARLSGERPVALVGTGTSWHAANQGAWLLRAAGVPARAIAAIDAAVHPEALGGEEQILLVTNRGSQRYVRAIERKARRTGALWGKISALGVDRADVTTVTVEASACVTAGHLAALARLAQLADLLGAPLDGLSEVPSLVSRALRSPAPAVEPPRALEFVGAGINQWTAAEGALKVREAARVPSNGCEVEHMLHGPIASLDERDALVVLDGGGPASERTGEVAAAAARAGVRVRYVREDDLGPLLSVFALTATVQRIAIERAECLGANPDSFGFEQPRRWAAFAEIWSRL